MGTRNYRHTAYWFAKKQGWTQSDTRSYALEYLRTDACIVRELAGSRRGGGPAARPGGGIIGYDFNPFLFGFCLMTDIGRAMASAVRTVADPIERDAMKKSLLHDLRTLRRPFYYDRERKRRRLLAAARRKIVRRQTTAPQPTPEDVLKAWERRKESKEQMIVLGGMLHDLECYVDNGLRIDEDGNVVGRNGGIRGWLKSCLPELLPKYKTLMRYKAMAIRLRQATQTQDPVPTSTLLDERPMHPVLGGILEDFRNTFSFLMEAVTYHVDPETVLVAREDVLGPGKRPRMRSGSGGGGMDRPDGPMGRPDGPMGRPDGPMGRPDGAAKGLGDAKGLQWWRAQQR